MLVICGVMATGYSMFTEELTINGTAIAKMEIPEIEVPPVERTKMELIDFQ